MLAILIPFSGEHQLKIADPDGGNSQDVALSGPYIPYDKEAPFFSPDGQSIIISGDVPGQSYQPNWIEKIMGIQSAKADGNLWIGGRQFPKRKYSRSAKSGIARLFGSAVLNRPGGAR